MPDVEALARIAAHWKIPIDELFPDYLLAAVADPDSARAKQLMAHKAGVALGLVALSLSGRNSNEVLAEALSHYSRQHDRLLLVRYEGSDASGVVEKGELILVDSMVKCVSDSGLYLLRAPDLGHHACGALRSVQVLMGQPTARVASIKSIGTVAEEIGLLPDGKFKNGIVVLGRVLGCLRAT